MEADNTTINGDATTPEDVLNRYTAESLPDFCQPLTDVNQIGTFANRPIHIASYRGDIRDVIALVNGGAKVNVQGDLGSTPLHEAVGQGHLEVVKFLLDRGADPWTRDELGRTPQDVARQAGRPEILELLTAGRFERQN